MSLESPIPDGRKNPTDRDNLPSWQHRPPRNGKSQSVLICQAQTFSLKRRDKPITLDVPPWAKEAAE